jgi:hypothetical protein
VKGESKHEVKPKEDASKTHLPSSKPTENCKRDGVKDMDVDTE